MQRDDRFHHSITVASDAALDAYHAGIDAMFALQPGALDYFDAAIELDSEFAMGYAARARAHLARADTTSARRDAEQAVSRMAHRTERERQHIQIVADGLSGRASLDAIYAHARAYPRDAIPISGALGVYGLIAFSGIADHHQVQLDFLRSLEPHWGDDWWFDTSRGWARIEGGHVNEGLEIALRAFEAHSDNAQGVHAISHGYYELGDVATGAAFLDEWLAAGVNGAPYSQAGGLHCHLSWHRALIALQLGDFDRMRAIYTAAIAPSASQAIPMLTYIDAAALAFRAHLAGADLAVESLDEIAAYDADHFQAGITFLDVHRLLTHLLRGDDVGLARLRGEVNDLPEHGARAVCLRLADAALARSAAVASAEQLNDAHADFARLGGSNAQRDLLIDWEIDAFRSAGETERARDVMAARQQSRAPHLDADWFERSARQAITKPS